MSASFEEKLQACVVLAFFLLKIIVYTGCLTFMCKFLMDTMLGRTKPNYYVISALLWMRSSLEAALQNDWSQCKTRLENLVLELRVLLEESHAYICLGVLLEAADLYQRLQKLVWTEIDEVTRRPQPQVWKFPFAVTLVKKPVQDDQWHMSLGVQILPILGAFCFGRPWCVCSYKPPEGEKGDRWYVKGSLELWSHRAAHIQSLILSAQRIANLDGRARSMAARLTVRGDARSQDVPVDL